MDNTRVPVSFKLHEVTKMYRQAVKDEMDKMGINPTYRYIFFTINSSKDGITQSEICETIHLKAPSVSLILQEMEEDGLIIRNKDEKDNRKTIVTLTEKGKKLDNKLKGIFESVDKRFEGLLEKEELICLNSLLDKIKNGLKGGEENV